MRDCWSTHVCAEQRVHVAAAGGSVQNSWLVRARTHATAAAAGSERPQPAHLLPDGLQLLAVPAPASGRCAKQCSGLCSVRPHALLTRARTRIGTQLRRHKQQQQPYTRTTARRIQPTRCPQPAAHTQVHTWRCCCIGCCAGQCSGPLLAVLPAPACARGTHLDAALEGLVRQGHHRRRGRVQRAAARAERRSSACQQQAPHAASACVRACTRHALAGGMQQCARQGDLLHATRVRGKGRWAASAAGAVHAARSSSSQHHSAGQRIPRVQTWWPEPSPPPPLYYSLRYESTSPKQCAKATICA